MVLHVTVLLAPAPRQVHEVALELPDGATVADAVQASGLLSRFTELAPTITTAVWGRKAPATQLLRDDDRVELVRPLRVDPKVARRERFNRQGTRAAGLFARKRPGGKAGY